MMKNAVALFLVLLVSVFAVAQEAQKSDTEIQAKKLYNEGLSALKTGKTSEAIAKFSEAVKLDPTLAVAHYALGIAYKRKKDYVNAEKAYQQAIKHDPQMDKAYIALGLLQTQMRKFNEAINTYKAALNINPNEPKAHWGIGYVYLKKKDYANALRYFKKAVELKPDYAKAWENLGVCYMQTAEYAKAVEALSKAIEHERINSSKDDTYLRLGDSYLKLKKLDEAESAYKNALKYTRQSTIRAAANFGLGEVYKMRGNKQLAISYYQKASRDRSWKQAALYEIDLLKNADKYTN